MNLVTRKVEVTEEDIVAGKPRNCMSCPVQLAIRRTFPEFDSVTVYERELTVTYKGWHSKTYLPEEVEVFIRAFDDPKRQDRLEPFSFELGVYV